MASTSTRDQAPRVKLPAECWKAYTEELTVPRDLADFHSFLQLLTAKECSVLVKVSVAFATYAMTETC